MPNGPHPSIDARTRYCAVLGHPIQHSASPPMQNAGLAALGLPWRYLAFDVHPDQLREAIEGARAMKFIGLNLTVPHKLLALKMVDELDESGKTWGAINTIRFEGRTAQCAWQPLGQLDPDPDPIREVRSVGFNTDADAIVRAVREDLGFELRGRSLLLLGAGGAAQAAGLRLVQEGAGPVFLVNRTRAKAEAMSAQLIRRFPGVAVTVGYPAGAVDLVLNATSVGLKHGDGLPFDPGAFCLKNARAAYDMIYRPAETPFLREARAAGCRAANGLGMLLYQGAKALEIWTGQAAPIEPMRRALEEAVAGRADIRVRR